MPSVREHLIYKALAALHDVRLASQQGPIRPNWQLRFCLAYLSTQCCGGREPFDYFWREMQNVHPSSTDGGSYMRHCDLGRAMSTIINRLGFNDTARISQCLGRPYDARAVHDFWVEVQQQLDDGRPMPTPRFRRG